MLGPGGSPSMRTLPLPAALVLAAVLLAGCSVPDATSEGATATTTKGASTATTPPPGGAGSAPTLALLEVAVVPETADLGDDLTARAIAKNLGGNVAIATVEFRLAGQLVHTAKATLQPGESTLLAATIKPGRTGTLPVEAKLVETGVTLTTTLLVHGPDLVDPKVTPLDLGQPDRVAHRVSFRNAGDGTAQGLRVEAQLLDEQGVLVDTIVRDLADLAPGQPTLVEFTHVARAGGSVPYTYTVHVIVTAQPGVLLEHDSEPFTV